MKLSVLVGENCDPDPDILGVTVDSRRVRPGDLFVAVKGTDADGADFVADALSNGAGAVLADRELGGASFGTTPVLVAADARRKLALAAAALYPGQPGEVAAITGTNGKTSTALFARQLWEGGGACAGSLGTLGAAAAGFSRPLRHTTPDPVALHQSLASLADHGVDKLAMEISSHGLAQHRADGVDIHIAAFTNITQDHLDYHETFAEYFDAKVRLFQELLSPHGVCVVNADGAGAERVIAVARARGVKLLTTGARGQTATLLSTKPRADGLDIKVEAGGAVIDVSLPLIGAFQAENALLAAGIASAGGEEPISSIITRLSALKGAPGRMERVASANGGGVFVDYAHTPAAIATAIGALRPHTNGRLIIVFGAGGDRDQTKRPLMGQAAQAADQIIITDDNPRYEDPAFIRAAVLTGAGAGDNVMEIGDRAEAIFKAVSTMTPGDTLLIAGKGHEPGQSVRGETTPFHDGDTARKAVAQFWGTTGEEP